MKRIFAGLSAPFVVGYALNFTWVCGVFFQGTMLATGNTDLTPWHFYLGSMIFLIATMIAIGCAGSRLHTIWERSACLVGAAAIIFLGTIASVFSSLQSNEGIVAFAAGIALTGIGSASVLIAWGCCLTRLSEHAIPNLCAAYIAAMALYSALALLPNPLFVGVVSLLPAASIAVFIRNRNLERARNPHAFDRKCDEIVGANDERDRGVPRTEFLRRTCLAAVLFGVALGIMNGTLAAADPSEGRVPFPTLFAVACAAPLLAIFLYCQLNRGKQALEERVALVYRTALLAMVCSFLLATDERIFRLVISTVALPGYICFKVLLWALFAHISNASRTHPIRIFAIGEACISAGLLLGNGMLHALTALSYQIDDDAMSLVIGLCVLLLLIAYIFVLNERAIIAIVSKESDDKPTHQRFTARCHRLAEERQLSPRETEILILFARGRSSTRIADDLYISSGTVSTHLRNVYRKLDVHSRQELIDLIEGEER